MRRLSCRSAMLATCAAIGLSLAVSGDAKAQEITLQSPDQSVVLRGTLRGFDGEFYDIDTPLGTLRVDHTLVECIGAICPEIKPPTSEFAVSGSGAMSRVLLPSLLAAYSEELRSRITQSGGASGVLYTITDDEEDDLARVQIRSSSSTNGIVDLLQGDVAMALSARPLRNQELVAFERSGLGNMRAAENEHVVALDGLVIVTAPGNPIRSISESEIARVFSGQIVNWADLGGPDAPIRLYTRGADTGTAEVFSNLVMRPNAAQISPSAQIVETDGDIGELVASDPWGIGFTSYGARGASKALPIRGVCGLISVPNAFNIKAEEYPLTRRLYAFSTDEQNPVHLAGLVDFAASNAAQQAIEDAGFVNQAITRSAVDEQGMRFASAIVSSRSSASLPVLREMVSDMMASDRLSATFRFETGASRLDTRALGDVERLAEILSQETAFRKQVQLIGFTDSVGNPLLNRDLSQRRAQQVANALLAARPELAERVEIETVGYGEISPIACNETAEGRRINRRVEVWVRDLVGEQRQ